jgi:hypothetical protein
MSDHPHPATPDPMGVEPAPPTSEAAAIPADADAGVAGAGAIALPAAETVEEAQAVVPPAVPEAPAVAPPATAAVVADAPPAISAARRRVLAARAGLARVLRFALVFALFIGGIAFGYQAHLSTVAATGLPVSDPATAGNQASPVVREFISAVATNDADAIRSAVPSAPYKLFTYEMERWSFLEVTSVDTLATYEDGNRTATEFVMNGRDATGNPIAINLVVETEDGNIVSFK